MAAADGGDRGHAGSAPLAEWAALNRAGAEMEEAAVRRRHPDHDEHDVLLALTRLRYGDDLVRGAWPDEPLRAPLIDLSASLRAVTAALDAVEVPYAVVGSTAAAAWGVLDRAYLAEWAGRLGLEADLADLLDGV